MELYLNAGGRRIAKRAIVALSIVAGIALAAPAFCGDTSGSAAKTPPGEGGPTGYSDPLSPFNEAMFTVNLKLDDWIIHPVASGYAKITPKPVRDSVKRFFNNAGVIPRVVSNLAQLKFIEAGTETARFGINSTVGFAGLFDPAQDWFGIKPKDNDFGLTLRYYDVPSGPYLMLPFFGPSTIGDAVGLAADSFMNPMYYFVPWYVSFASDSGQYTVTAINYRSLHLDQFEEADRYAVDLYGAVQDGYLQTRAHDVKQLHEENW